MQLLDSYKEAKLGNVVVPLANLMKANNLTMSRHFPVKGATPNTKLFMTLRLRVSTLIMMIVVAMVAAGAAAIKAQSHQAAANIGGGKAARISNQVCVARQRKYAAYIVSTFQRPRLPNVYGLCSDIFGS